MMTETQTPSSSAADDASTALPPTAGSAAGATTDAPSDPPSDDSRNLAVLSHLSALIALAGVPGFVGPLAVWLWQRDRDPWVGDHARDALNFQLSLLIYAVGSLALAVVTLGLGLLVAVPVIVVAIVASVVVPILAALRAADGGRYTYPLTLQLLN